MENMEGVAEDEAAKMPTESLCPPEPQVSSILQQAKVAWSTLPGSIISLPLGRTLCFEGVDSALFVGSFLQMWSGQEPISFEDPSASLSREHAYCKPKWPEEIPQS